jgi:hypothetical protein
MVCDADFAVDMDLSQEEISASVPVATGGLLGGRDTGGSCDPIWRARQRSSTAAGWRQWRFREKQLAGFRRLPGGSEMRAMQHLPQRDRTNRISDRHAAASGGRRIIVCVQRWPTRSPNAALMW